MIGTGASVMLCDSQASDSYSESHGIQKLIPGSDFLIGGTGSVDIIRALFSRISIQYAAVNAGNIRAYLANALDEMLEPAAKTQVEFLVMVEDQVIHFRPGIFRQGRDRGNFFTVGSGGEFVWRAYARDNYLGIQHPTSTPADTFATVEALLDAADESLTVDDQLMLGLVSKGKAYVTGDATINPTYIPTALDPHWDENVRRFQSLRALAEQLRGELRQAQRSLSRIREGALGVPEIAAIQAANAAIATSRATLNAELADFVRWYDGVVGR
jgi:hypothetical protein